jgi:hypothetical protein
MQYLYKHPELFLRKQPIWDETEDLTFKTAISIFQGKHSSICEEIKTLK